MSEKSNMVIIRPHSWHRDAFYEGFTKTTVKIFQNLFGRVANNWAHCWFASLIMGITQVVSGLVTAKRYNTTIFVEKTIIIWSCIWGASALISSMGSFVAFLDLKADMVVNTFIVTLSLVPGALLGKLFFNEPFTRRTAFGMIVGIFSGWFVLGCPSVSKILSFPIWVWGSLVTMFFNAINNCIDKKITLLNKIEEKKLNRERKLNHVKNAWGGLTTAILCLLIIFIIGRGNMFLDFSRQMGWIWFGSIVIGILVYLMASFSLFAYTDNTTVPLKKLAMNCAWLSTVAIADQILYFLSHSPKFNGWLLHLGISPLEGIGKPFSVYKGLGIVGMLLALAITDERGTTILFQKIRIWWINLNLFRTVKEI
jgi:hypothetical protein